MIGFILGTSEGKKFLSLINEYTEDIIVSTATEYGGELLSDYKVKHINTKPLDKDGLNKLIKDFNIKVLVDASHPYAEIVSKNAMESCKESNIEYIRYERLGVLSKENSKNIIRVKSYEELETVINNIPGNILNTTGSKNIGKILRLNIENRVIHRILPSWQILKEVLELGVEVSDVVAIKGPIGYELNKGFIYQDNIKAIITKDSGVQGGVLEKLKATTDTNIKLIVIEKTRIEYGQVFNKEEEIVNYLKIKYKALLKK
ncbi:cobalt-precorrin-6A reductase [Clostridium gasigenes]|uniref:Precorrin-6A/cobalt-precorrin-6A reductase n=1 Tax=Clostridium gasigenes TaxID=94869 RepID=A0A1H0U5E6_9CLOT|nr:cobalt-precorrin-6A reductase [Clostridium gasigenes]SDP61205.1 precorrin-6A/cobalt-precorrin-6A reductase [Clostridium gasigenes]